MRQLVERKTVMKNWMVESAKLEKIIDDPSLEVSEKEEGTRYIPPCSLE
jgi:hypothetical protein